MQTLTFRLEGLGQIYLMTNQIKSAKDVFAQSAEIRAKNSKHTDRSLAHVFLQLAMCEFQLSEFPSSFEHAQVAYNIYEQIAPDSIDFGQAALHLGNAQRKTGKVDESLKSFELAKSIFEKDSQSHVVPLLGETYYQMALTHHSQKKMSCIEFYKKAAEIFGKVYPPTHPKIVNIDNNLKNLTPK